MILLVVELRPEFSFSLDFFWINIQNPGFLTALLIRSMSSQSIKPLYSFSGVWSGVEETTVLIDLGQNRREEEDSSGRAI
jgi:hypothetical protein